MKLPIEVEQLPEVDPLVLDAICIEQEKSTTVMGRTLRSYGWSPMQVAYVEDRWGWAWIAKAIVHERQQRGEGIVHHSALDEVQRVQPGAVAARAEAVWVDEHGDVEPPRPPAAPGTPIQLPARPARPATTADASAYLSVPEPESQGERL